MRAGAYALDSGLLRPLFGGSVKTLRSVFAHAPLRTGNQMFVRLLYLRLELLFLATGSSVLQLFGRKEPGELASWLTGVALWILAGLAILILTGF